MSCQFVEQNAYFCPIHFNWFRINVLNDVRVYVIVQNKAKLEVSRYCIVPVLYFVVQNFDLVTILVRSG